MIHEAVAAIVSGWALRDADVLRAGMTRYEGAGAHVATSFFRGLLTEVLLELGAIAAARTEVATALALAERSGEQRHLPELHRLDGECLRRFGAAGSRSRKEARACFDRARALARHQSARLWELRAAISTAELLAADEAEPAARELLDESLRSFADGGDLPDVGRAHSLRLALASGGAPRGRSADEALPSP